ncbi:MAG: hypothetical protein KKA60_15745 [Proteobacteria bacterium]|nr:hypothetical protein [Pseudomonadota bacterium]
MSDEKQGAGLAVHEPAAGASPEPEKAVAGKKKGNKIAWLALLVALVALFLVLSQDRGVEKASVESINRMVTDTVVPEMKRSRERDLVNAIYDLKHVQVTLEQIKETSDNEEIQVMVDQIKKQVEELSVKLFVHE